MMSSHIATSVIALDLLLTTRALDVAALTDEDLDLESRAKLAAPRRRLRSGAGGQPPRRRRRGGRTDRPALRRRITGMSATDAVEVSAARLRQM
jgi:hypothetical protein